MRGLYIHPDWAGVVCLLVDIRAWASYPLVSYYQVDTHKVEVVGLIPGWYMVGATCALRVDQILSPRGGEDDRGVVCGKQQCSLMFGRPTGRGGLCLCSVLGFEPYLDEREYAPKRSE